jgi:CTP synthase
MLVGGISPQETIVEIIELQNHPWFVACQFHPEFKSRPNRPHSLFMGFLKRAIEKN